MLPVLSLAGGTRTPASQDQVFSFPLDTHTRALEPFYLMSELQHHSYL